MRALKCDRCGCYIGEKTERWYLIEQHLPYCDPLKRELCRYCSFEIMKFLSEDIKKEIKRDDEDSE